MTTKGSWKTELIHVIFGTDAWKLIAKQFDIIWTHEHNVHKKLSGKTKQSEVNLKNRKSGKKIAEENKGKNISSWTKKLQRWLWRKLKRQKLRSGDDLWTALKPIWSNENFTLSISHSLDCIISWSFVWMNWNGKKTD